MAAPIAGYATADEFGQRLAGAVKQFGFDSERSLKGQFEPKASWTFHGILDRIILGPSI
jgi:hypothetical protein